MSSAIVTAAWVPVRAEPSHRAEMTSQWLCGEALQVDRESNDWLECEGPDGYVGWSPAGSLRRVDAGEAAKWKLEAGGWSLGTRLERPETDGSCEAGHTAAAIPNHLPWGARVRILEAGRVGLPGGEVALAKSPESVLGQSSLRDRFPPVGSSVVSTAELWLGAPYVWGGRIGAGVDCSGLVQAVFAAHGIPLPRDSGDQVDAGSALELANGWPDDPRPGDLLFFSPEGRGVSHVAIAAGEGRIIHSAASNGSVGFNDLAGEGRLDRLLAGSIVRWTRPLES